LVTNRCGQLVRRDHDAIHTPPAADPTRLSLPLRMQRGLLAREEAVVVEMQDAVPSYQATNERKLEGESNKKQS